MKKLLITISPYKDESLYNFITRLAKVNQYKLHWIYNYLGIENIRNDKPYINYADRSQIIKISTISGIKEFKIYQLSFHQFASALSDKENIKKGLHYFKNGRKLSHINIINTKYCPLCLESKKYHRIFWNLNLITICPIHNVFLVDSCSECGNKIEIIDVIEGIHSCGKKLSLDNYSVVTNKISEKTQSYIQHLLGIKKMRQQNVLDQKVMALSPNHFFNLFYRLSLINYNLLFPKRKKKSHIYSEITNKQINKLLDSTFEIFYNFKKNLYLFLDQITNENKHDYSSVYNSSQNIIKNFQELKGEPFNFVAKAIQEYYLTWDKGLITGVSFLDDSNDSKMLLKKRKFVSVEDACNILKISRKKVIILLNNNLIKSEKKSLNGKVYFLIRRKSVENLKKNWKEYYTIYEVAKKLNVNYKLVKKIINYNLLNTYTPFSNSKIKLIPREEVEKFTKTFYSNKMGDNEWINIYEAVKILNIKNGIVKILKLVRMGFLKSYNNKNNFKSLEFKKNEILKIKTMIYLGSANKYIADEKLINNSLLKRIKPTKQIVSARIIELNSKKMNKCFYISLKQMENLIKIDQEVIKHWIQYGILEAKIKSVGEKKYRFIIKIDDLYNFCSQYMFTMDVSNLLEISKDTVLNWVHNNIINAYSGLNINGSRYYIFKREEILNLKNNFKNYYLTTKQVSKYLNVSKRYIYRLVKDRKLNPLRGKYLFKKEEIDILKEELNEYITVTELAERLKIEESKIIKLIKNNKLKVKYTPCSGYFNRYVMKRGQIKKYYNYMNVTEVAEYLNVAKITVRKWIRDKRLKALQGPCIDGERSYKLSRIDVEEFKIQYTSLKESKGHNTQYNLINLEEVTKIFNYTKSYVYELIKQKKIIPYKTPDENNSTSYLFKKFDIKRKKELLDANVITAKEAAEMLNEDLSWFYKKWVISGRLKKVNFTDSLGDNFFDKNDVKQIVKLRKDTIRGSEAAKIIGVTRNTILKWKRKNKIIPVSGPDIDGSGYYLYLKKDVMELKKKYQK